MGINARSRKRPAILAAVAVSFVGVWAQQYPPGFPRAGSVKILDNDRVVIWDATWHKGVATPLHEHPVDYLSVTLAQGAVKVTERDGTSNVGPAVPLGFVRFNPRGIVHIEEGVSDQERRAIMVELKDYTPPAGAPSATGQGMFPAAGATKLIDNARVTVWDFTWPSDRRLAPYQQRHDVVVVFLQAGTIRREEGGTTRDLRKDHGDVDYVRAGETVQTEQAIDGSPRAVFIELKQ